MLPASVMGFIMKANKGKRWLLVLVCVLGLTAAAVPCWAEGALTAGPLKLHGQLMGTWQNRSNIFLTENNKTADNIYRLEPVLGVRHDLTSTSWWSLEYQGIFAWYNSNNSNDWQSHLGSFDSRFGGKTGPYVQLKNVYQKTEDPFGSENLYRLGEKTKRQMNNFRVAPGYQLGEKSQVEVFYENLFTKYDLDRDKSQNQRENRFGGTYYHKFWAKTSALVQYRYVTREYYDQPSSLAEDFKRQDAFVGLRWDATAKLRGEAKIGYSWQDYDNEFNPAGQKYDKKADVAAEVDLTYQATTKTTLMLGVERNIKESTYINSNYYIDTNASLGIRYQLFTNIMVLAKGTIGKNEYNNIGVGTTSRDDNVYKLDLGAEYSFLKYMFLRGGYTMDKKDSNLTGLSYTDDIFYVSLGGRF